MCSLNKEVDKAESRPASSSFDRDIELNFEASKCCLYPKDSRGFGQGQRHVKFDLDYWIRSDIRIHALIRPI
jgi:hypothetical protein